MEWIIAEIKLADIQQWIPMVTALLVVAFDWGILYAKIKTFVNKEEVSVIVEKKLDGHCPNVARIENVELKMESLEKWRHEHLQWGEKENSKNHLQLQEIRINLKNICEKLGVEYLNGTKY